MGAASEPVPNAAPDRAARTGRRARGVFATTEPRMMLFGVGVLALGCVTFLVWSRRDHRGPSGEDVPGRPAQPR